MPITCRDVTCVSRKLLVYISFVLFIILHFQSHIQPIFFKVTSLKIFVTFAHIVNVVVKTEWHANDQPAPVHARTMNMAATSTIQVLH